MARWRIVALLLVTLGACAHSPPRVAVGSLDDGLAPFLAAHPLGVGENIRVDEIARNAAASYHLVQVRHGERSHRHRTHALTVVVLGGHGVLALGSEHVPMSAGDVALVPAGTVHYFSNRGRDVAVALVVFTPPLDVPDTEAVDVDSLQGRE
jgi:quercetin dioxygenase-like cupin family protein